VYRGCLRTPHWCGRARRAAQFKAVGRRCEEQVDYETVYDLLDRGYDGWPSVIQGLLFVAIGVVLYLFRSRMRWPVQRVLFGYVWLAFSLFWTVSVAWGTVHRYHWLRQAVLSNRTDVVSGPVREFVPMPYHGHAYERFCVEEECFQYSDFDETGGGFNNTQSHGGPIKAGLPVRVTYVGGTIVRLEVATQ